MNKNLFKFKHFQYNRLIAMIRRNPDRSITGIIVRLFPAMQGNVSKSLVSSIKKMLKDISKLGKSQGFNGMCKYLKMCGVLTQQSMCGYIIPSTTPRVSRTNAGLPRIIPSEIRVLIRKGHAAYMRLTLTMFSMYRDFLYPIHKNDIKTKTITDPFKGNDQTVKEVISNIPRFVKLFVKVPVSERRALISDKFEFIPISKASPQSTKGLASTNPIVLIRSALALSSLQIEAIKVLAMLSGKPGTDPNHLKIMQYLSRIRVETMRNKISKLKPVKVFSDKEKTMVKINRSFTPKPSTRSLSIKIEGAGKVRVFALVDPWTQMVLRPFHIALFKILSRHKQMDGTFNQLGPLSRAFNFKQLYSMDLSAATDRLPISIQVPLIQEIFSLTNLEAQAWSYLLVGDSYYLPELDKWYRYSVGQPMGALSSWAMLAMTHHLIVQSAAWRVGFDRGHLFRDYVVLGDDIVIFNKRVAKSYLALITGLGVECNPAKSIYSRKGIGLEFAKKTFVRSVNVSPIPLKEMHSALQSPAALLEFGRAHNLSFPTLLKVAGFGYRVLGKAQAPFHKQTNFKVKCLQLVSLFSQNLYSAIFKKALGHHGMGVLASSLHRMTTERLEATQKSLVRDREYLFSNSSLLKDLVPQTWLTQGETWRHLDGFPRLLQDLFFSIVSEYRLKFTLRLSEAGMEMIRLQYARLPDLTGQELFDAVTERLRKVVEVEKGLSAFSLEMFKQLRLQDEVPRYYSPKVMGLINSWNTVFHSFIKGNVNTVTSELQAPRDLELTYKASSFFPFRALRGLFFTSHHTVSRVKRFRSPNFRTIPLPSSSFGIRTMLWLWLSEGLLSLLFLGLTYPLWLLLVLLYSWLNGEGSLLTLFPMIFEDFIPNLSIDDLKKIIWSFFTHGQQGIRYNLILLTSWITLQVFSTGWFHTELASVFYEGFNSGIPMWQLYSGFILGTFYKFGIYPLYNTLIAPIGMFLIFVSTKLGYPELLTFFPHQFDNMWLLAFQEVSRCISSFVLCQYQFIVNGLHYETLTITDIPTFDAELTPRNSYIEPQWQSEIDHYLPEQPEASTSQISNIESDDYVWVDEARTELSWYQRMSLMAINHPYIYGGTYMICAIGIKLLLSNSSSLTVSGLPLLGVF